MDGCRATYFLLIPAMVFARECTSPSYTPHRVEHALSDHVIATFQVTWEWGCVMKCQDDARCRSFNYQDDNLPGSPYHTCEINSATRYTHGGTFYHRREGFTYYESEIVHRLASPIVGSREQPGRSCRQILQVRGTTNDGQYWIDPDNSGLPFLVYCDMSTDGGGWTLIKRTVLNSSTPLTGVITVSDYRMISEQVENRIVNNDGLVKLKQDMGFDQLRFYCHKKSVGRTFHIMTNNDTLGRNAVRSMIETFKPRAQSCGSFTVLPGDTSVLSKNCAKWGYMNGFSASVWGSNYPGRKGKDRLYSKSAFWNSSDKSKTYLIEYLPPPTHKYNCDDSSSTVAAGDTFEIYVR